eukprot:TRINITY_DN14002_c0_g1_i1.p1 TRINITY_DN14002_c0_g1~~TRINITY_DN14002_c0_g1_i1.p1  ORF type:complete len:281 (+),score=35.50 TRINITY_DN14002_c0_g1_i1:86-928(+)
MDERVTIAHELLVASPPGEFGNVVNDVRALVADDQLLNQSAFEAFRQYNTEQLLPIDIPGGSSKVLITQFNELDPTHYVDPVTRQVVTVDHVKQEISDVRPMDDGETPVAAEAHRTALFNALAKYVKEFYPEGAYSVFATSDTELVVVISAAKFKLENFWTGRWRSVWKVTLNGTNAALSATVKATVHYFENGNVQLNTNWSTNADATGLSSPEAGAKSIATAIQKAESAYHQALEESYANLPVTTFKTLRRALPITKALMNWAALGSYRIGGDIHSKGR